MDMMEPDKYSLCIRCRVVGHSVSACQQPGTIPSDLLKDEILLASLRSGSSSLCGRCTSYTILDIFSNANVVDVAQHLKYVDSVNHVSNVMNDWLDNQRQHYLVLGRYSSVVLDGKCPLCRLVFRIFPPESEEDNGKEDTIYYVRPFPSYDRQSSFLQEKPMELKKEYSLYFSVECEEDATKNVTNFFGDPDGQMVNRVWHAFALSSQNPAPNRHALGARKTSSLVDYGLCQMWLERCKKEHGASCHRTWSDELLTCSMIDVQTRKVVSCPKNCDYVALSYVWGNIKPVQAALGNPNLPQTIEDAITVTANLGIRYLWVDALCVDQTPTPQQAQQLAMMDEIYQCSTVTIIAMSGEDSAGGLPGVSATTSRIPQGAEMMEGKQILTIFPMLVQDMENMKYQTRAWTMQEALLSRCRLVFTKHQVHWWCSSAAWSECIDETDDPANYTACYHPEKQESWYSNPARTSQQYTVAERLNIGEEDYRECLENYTGRSLTNDSDSLNAFLGIVGYLRKAWIPNGFVWGMPLQDFPQALRWFHPRQVKPRRRPSFPSWSWCGWDGQATYSGPLNLMKTQGRGYTPVGSAAGRADVKTDMTVRYVGVEDRTLTVEGYRVTLDIRTNPFSEAYVLDTEESLGPVRERNFLHNNTLATGRYDFLVVERLRYRTAPDRPLREDVYMLLLDWDGEFGLRRTKVRLSLDTGQTFDAVKPQLRTTKLK